MFLPPLCFPPNDPDPDPDPARSLLSPQNRNVFRAYWSMATVWSLMSLYSLERGFQYDAVVLARPDVWFHVDIDLPR